MKTNFMSKLSLTLLLSTPLAMHAVRTKAPLIEDSTPCHAQGLNPYEQRAQMNAKIQEMQGTIANLQKQHDAIAPEQTQITLASSAAKGENKDLLVETGKKIRDMSALAATTNTLIWQKKSELSAEQAKLAVLAKRIAILEPSTEDLPALIETVRKSLLPSIKAWKKGNFTYCKTTKVPKKDADGQVVKNADKVVKIDQRTLAASDKSAPYFIKEEQPKTWKGSAASVAAYAVSFVHANPTIKVITVPAGQSLGDTFAFTKPSQASTTTATTTAAAATVADDKK